MQGLWREKGECTEDTRTKKAAPIGATLFKEANWQDSRKIRLAPRGGTPAAAERDVENIVSEEFQTVAAPSLNSLYVHLPNQND